MFYMVLIVSLLLLMPSVAPAAAGFNCTRSAMCMKEIEQLRIEEIKRTILSELHMSSPPMVSPRMSDKLTEEFLRMSSQAEEPDDEEKLSETSFFVAKDASRGLNPSELMASFDIDALKGKELSGARLDFRVTLPSGSEVESVTVQVYEKNMDGSLGEMITSKKHTIAGDRRVSVELPVDTVTGWLNDSPIAGIFVSAKINGHNVAIHPQQTIHDYENMILQLSVAKGVGRSRRAMSPMCNREENTVGCCLYDLKIDFPAIGWDWIIQPKVYNAFLCKGNCVYNGHHYSLVEAGHTKIMKAASRMDGPDKYDVGNVGFCCHPVEYEYMTLVYLNRNGVITVAKVNGMVATRCACT